MSTLFQDIEEAGLHFGRMISGNKTAPKGHRAFFNACIFDKDLRQVWYGDIDLDVSLPALQRVASTRQEKFYVTREQPYRFEGLDKRELKKPDANRIVVIDPATGYPVDYPS